MGEREKREGERVEEEEGRKKGGGKGRRVSISSGLASIDVGE